MGTKCITYMGVLFFIIGSLSVVCAFLYEYSADYIHNKCFTEMSREEMIENFGSDSIPEDVDETDEPFMLFDVSKASPYVFIMYVCYFPSLPIREFVNLFR